MGAQMIGLIWIISSRLLHADWDRWLPKFAVSAVFIWHFIVLGLLVLIGAVLVPILLVKNNRPLAQTRSTIAPRPAPRAKRLESPRISPDRRRDRSAAFHPQPHRHRAGPAQPLPRAPFRSAHSRSAARSRWNDDRARQRHARRAIHFNGKVLRRLVDAVNELRADLVLVTGDLINDALADLDHGIELVRAMQGRFGLYMIEGNHDLIEDGAEFERRVKLSGIPFLLDESAIVEVRGTPVQLLGLSWTRARENRDAAIAQSVHALLQQRRADLFPILLAHHPHAFDAAAESKLPLILSGHTHGGQLMLNEQYGGGPAIFRYWSGLYTRGESQMIVSNGVGNWFPLRVNAPAELIHLTLRRES